VAARPAPAATPRRGRAVVGISGYDYKGWAGVFYPAGLPKARWLAHASRTFDSVELNGTFYSLKSPAVFARWASEVPPRGFEFAIKGGRFITHNLKLRRAESALGNFFASGILALGTLTGPFLWQLPATYGFDAERVASFLARLPRNSAEGEAVASWHDERLRRGALTESAARVTYRHAMEVRHPSYFHEEFYAVLREYRVGLVLADTAGKFPYAEELTSDLVYIRLHGSTQLYTSGYSDAELDWWAARIQGWRATGRDVYTYFDNDAKVHAPFDALRLRERLDAHDAGDGRDSRGGAR
jgi:uncharacterized protein YecE (DUF72 family)